MTRRAVSRLLSALVAGTAYCLASGPALAGDRIALVIGNAAYRHVDALDNATRDARDIAAMLRGFGFAVHEGYDLDRRGFEALLRTTLLNTPEGADVVFFYAGHGIQLGRRNYLLPVDAAFESVYDLPASSVTLDRVIELLSARGTAHVAMIDACRENPFPSLMLAANLDASLFEAKAGFEIFRTPINSLVAFSTSPGEIAFDGEKGGNGPYTGAVLAAAQRLPEENILNLLADVREQVFHNTGGRQVPWESSTLVRPFRLMSDGALPVATLAVASGGAEGPRGATLVEAAPVTAPPPLADTVELALVYDRQLQIPSGTLTMQDPVLLAPPENGQVSFTAAGGLVYRPTLAETRAATMTEFRVSDSFRILTGPAAARQEVTVRLELSAGACDIAAGDALDLQGVGLYRLPNEIDPPAALQACRSAVAAQPEVARLRYQLGRAQQASGDLPAAYASFSAAAAAGHVRALNALAYLLFTSRIDRGMVAIPLDAARADGLLDQAIAAGDPFAMHVRGQRLLRNGADDAARQRGFELLERAAELGHTYSMNELGSYFLNPERAQHNPERGMVYLRASSARDDIYGHYNLGLAALRGRDGQAPDYRLARDYLERAAYGGHPHAPAALGRMVMRGQLGVPDPRAALQWYDMALARGDGWGGANAAALILEGGEPRLGPADAAWRAARAVHLSSREARDAALAQLNGLAPGALDLATQMLLRDMGEAVTLDGAIGPGTRAALERQRARYGVTAVEDAPLDRLLLAARLLQAANPPRIDLF